MNFCTNKIKEQMHSAASLLFRIWIIQASTLKVWVFKIEWSLLLSSLTIIICTTVQRFRVRCSPRLDLFYQKSI